MSVQHTPAHFEVLGASSVAAHFLERRCGEVEVLGRLCSRQQRVVGFAAHA